MKIISTPSDAPSSVPAVARQNSSSPTLSRRKFRRTAENDPRAKYRVLPPPVSSDDVVAEVDTDVTDVEHGGKPDFENRVDP
jgi:hypothetical protein